MFLPFFKWKSAAGRNGFGEAYDGKRNFGACAQAVCSGLRLCAAGFFREENVVRILNARPPQARKDLTSKRFFDVVSIGRNSVVCACDALGEEAREFACTFRGKDCFGVRALRWIDEKLGRHGLTAGTPTLYFLLLKERKICSAEGMRFCRLEKEELSEYYLPEWRNALCYKRRELDAFAVATFRGDRLAGLAGASCDCMI